MARHGNPPGAPGTHGPPSDDALSNYDQVHYLPSTVSRLISYEILFGFYLKSTLHFHLKP
jgi:hypothetical protein